MICPMTSPGQGDAGEAVPPGGGLGTDRGLPGAARGRIHRKEADFVGRGVRRFLRIVARFSVVRGRPVAETRGRTRTLARVNPGDP